MKNNKKIERLVTKCLVVKIGSSAITEGATNNQPLNKTLIKDIAIQCGELFKAGVKIAIVSSGAVACGRFLLHLSEQDTVDRQVEAAYGQPYLIKSWIDAFSNVGIKTSQILLSETDLESAKLPLIRAMEHGIVIINANDSVSDQEMGQFLVSADNDRLAKFVALGIEADTLLILTDVQGVLDAKGNFVQDGNSIDITNLSGNSIKGTGGMVSKVKVAKEAGLSGIKAFIGEATHQNIIVKVASGKTQGVCTSFVKHKVK